MISHLHLENYIFKDLAYLYNIFLVALDIVASGIEYCDFKIGICSFFAKHAALRSESKYWQTQNRDNASKWSDMSILKMLFQWASAIKIQLNVLI